jgi:hypothetical protein
MKIEFVKEVGLDDKPLFYTRIDNSLVSDSLKFTEEDAKKIYDRIVELKGKTTLKEVLYTSEI